jgi:DNA polymerase I-like protein with 3'-5' exonuclease and polymerase domains
MKTEIVFDLETTVQRWDNIKDNSPYNKKNKIVGAYWRVIEDGVLGPAKRAVFFHKEQDTPDSIDEFVSDLNRSSRGICHNSKFDYSYLLEAGFKLPPPYCTMIGEHILARGTDVLKSLKATAERRDVTRKKSELVDELFKSGVDFSEMPLATVNEYADADVLATAEIYIQQSQEWEEAANTGLKPIVRLMNENTEFLIEIERNGAKIDLDELAVVKQELLDEQALLTVEMSQLVIDLMGDTPVNLASGEDRTKLIYSRRILDKGYHKRTFNIGTNAQGKPLPYARMSDSKFVNTVRKSTRRVMKTVAYHCDDCNGRGTFRKFKANGEPWKNTSKCAVCDGRGVRLVETNKVAGLKLIPDGPQDASANGFKSDKMTINRLIKQAENKDNLDAIKFLTMLTRLNALSTYLDSFVKGIETWTRAGGLLHAQFNQTTAKTSRLSSSNPNFQNQPKKFPVRRCVVSRWDGGEIYEMDYSGLEFRAAGLLSRDPQIISDIAEGKDVHKQTAAIINQCEVSEVSKQMRQAAKAYTFAPLYGGMGMAEAEHVQAYFKKYFTIYKGLADWHKSLADGVLKDGMVRTPSGREFHFPNAKRMRGGRVTNHTQVVNFPCQSFATADIVPVSCIRALRKFRELGLTSKLILTVHDSIVVDVFPGERDAVTKALTWSMRDIGDELKERFDFDLFIPLDVEADSGPNWLEMTPVSL